MSKHWMEAGPALLCCLFVCLHLACVCNIGRSEKVPLAEWTSAVSIQADCVDGGCL